MHGDVLYKTIQDSLLIQEQYVPGEGTESLYAVIDETHAGRRRIQFRMMATWRWKRANITARME